MDVSRGHDSGLGCCHGRGCLKAVVMAVAMVVVLVAVAVDMTVVVVVTVAMAFAIPWPPWVLASCQQS